MRTPPPPCWSGDRRRRCRRSGGDLASPSPTAAAHRAPPRPPAGHARGSRRPWRCRRASRCKKCRCSCRTPGIVESPQFLQSGRSSAGGSSRERATAREPAPARCRAGKFDAVPATAPSSSVNAAWIPALAGMIVRTAQPGTPPNRHSRESGNPRDPRRRRNFHASAVPQMPRRSEPKPRYVPSRVKTRRALSSNIFVRSAAVSAAASM